MDSCIHMVLYRICVLMCNLEFGFEGCQSTFVCSEQYHGVQWFFFYEDTVSISGHRISLAEEGASKKVMAMGVWTDEKKYRKRTKKKGHESIMYCLFYRMIYSDKAFTRSKRSCACL
jgi:hypothetical protein